MSDRASFEQAVDTLHHALLGVIAEVTQPVCVGEATSRD